MKRWLFAIAALVLPPAAANAAAEFKIATADPRGTYFAIGNDLAKMVAPTADIALEVVPTDGSAHNIRLLREAPGVKFAIVQADVFQTFVDRAAAARTGRRPGSSGRCASSCRSTTPRSITSPARIPR